MIPDLKNPKHCSYNWYFHLDDPWGLPGGPLRAQKYFSPLTHIRAAYTHDFRPKKKNIAHKIDIFTSVTLGGSLLGPSGSPLGTQKFFSFINTYPQPIFMIPDLKNPRHCSYNLYFHLGEPWGPPWGDPWGPINIFSFKNTYRQPILTIPDRKNPKHCSYNRYFPLGDP